MFKNTIIALGIAALTSSSAFAATKTVKAKTPIHQVAQASESKAAGSKSKKTAKADKKMKKETKAAAPAAEPAK